MLPRIFVVVAGVFWAAIATTALLTVTGDRRGSATERGDSNMSALSETGKDIGDRGTDELTGKHQNRLANESSPYLLQHANNPVDWYPWGDEAFEKATRQDKPIFLSIGYSTCHWCHVMAHETFENEEAAALMNDTFVSIKVDREERPDIDHIYMTVSQMMTGGGGWPLNIIMTPDKKPFFAGTYIPRESRFGRIGMMDLSRRIKELWTTQREDVLSSASKIFTALNQVPDDSPGEVHGQALLDQAYEDLLKRFDEQHGGFSQAPKFPTPHNLFFLMRYWKRTNRRKALAMVEQTLQNMRLGGVYDHVGLGFHRYSTDAEWLVPHFEKMLYDQAMLAIAYTEAYQATGKPEYADTAREVFTYVLRDMTAPEGGFYSAEDADSEGEEGKFYVWTLQEVRDLLGTEDADFAARVFNLKPDGNFREEATGQMTGTNIFHLRKPLSEIASDLGTTEDALRSRMESVRQELFTKRETRVHPHKDDKILSDWNGLMIAALAVGARTLDRPEYGAAAIKAADFVLEKLRTKAGRLLHRYRQVRAGIAASVDDYVYLIWGLLELYETTFEVRYLKSALDLNGDLVKYFWDDENGGFYFTASDSERLLVRSKEIYDGATPSGNSVAMLNLLRLSRITAQPELEQRADWILRAFAGNVKRFPSAYTQLLTALEFEVGPSYEVVVAADPDSEDAGRMIRKLRRPFVPGKVVLLRPPGEAADSITSIAPYTKNQKRIQEKATAYVCLNFSCELPTTDPDKMLILLGVKNP
jgi:uncharacterized protein YyaL (SSP411 family)